MTVRAFELVESGGIAIDWRGTKRATRLFHVHGADSEEAAMGAPELPGLFTPHPGFPSDPRLLLDAYEVRALVEFESYRVSCLYSTDRSSTFTQRRPEEDLNYYRLLTGFQTIRVTIPSAVQERVYIANGQELNSYSVWRVEPFALEPECRPTLFIKATINNLNIDQIGYIRSQANKLHRIPNRPGARLWQMLQPEPPTAISDIKVSISYQWIGDDGSPPIYSPDPTRLYLPAIARPPFAQIVSVPGEELTDTPEFEVLRHQYDPFNGNPLADPLGWMNLPGVPPLT